MIKHCYQSKREQTGSLLIFLFLLLAILNSCSDEYEGIPIDKDEAYDLEKPSGFPQMTFDITGNPITVNGVALGKKLFYEGKLSRNNTISCGFCHIQEYAFTHH
ncbi:Di-haem cytochrome c peroxidase [Chryseobacterium profundimaris]|uniref:Di-haem cytochrome c peroxidase n=1 Tax=Chryseobacterium profundimaris TaxID=1387275 RepID=A0ABY1NMB4_9FLAO|nr:Di-haem cytochrome c peroxidase [Chryseobacterium profundimaris]